MHTVNLSTNLGSGGIAVLHLNGAPTAAILRLLPALASMREGEIVHTWLRDNANELVDEILIHKIAAEKFLITGHGGSACALALLKTCVESGYRATAANNLFGAWGNFFAECQTAHQLTTVARYYEKAKTGGENFGENGTEIATATATALAEILRPRRIALVGTVNVGKSSLLNCLLSGDAALVSEIAGTTYDAASYCAEFGGYACVITDTAGFHAAATPTEILAQRRAAPLIANAELIILIFAADRELNADDHAAMAAARAANKNSGAKIIIVYNKCELAAQIDENAVGENFPAAPTVKISCKENINLENLRNLIGAMWI